MPKCEVFHKLYFIGMWLNENCNLLKKIMMSVILNVVMKLIWKVNIQYLFIKFLNCLFLNIHQIKVWLYTFRVYYWIIDYIVSDFNTNSNLSFVTSEKKPEKYQDPFDRFQQDVGSEPGVRLMYPKEKVYCGGLEFQLEEIRAFKWIENQRQVEKSWLA